MLEGNAHSRLIEFSPEENDSATGHERALVLRYGMLYRSMMEI